MDPGADEWSLRIHLHKCASISDCSIIGRIIAYPGSGLIFVVAIAGCFLLSLPALDLFLRVVREPSYLRLAHHPPASTDHYTQGQQGSTTGCREQYGRPASIVELVVGGIISSLFRQRAPDDGQSERHHREVLRWTKLTFFGLLFYSVITFGLFIVGICQTKISQQTMVAANRAWLAPTVVEFLNPIEDPDGPVIIVRYQNIGRYPALDVKSGMGPVAVPFDQGTNPREYPKSQMWPSIDKTIRDGCNANQPLVGAADVFPSTTKESNLIAGMKDQIDKSLVQSGAQIILVTGCLTYRTFNEIHRTGFCQYASKTRINQWEFLSCPVGNFAD